MAGQGLGHRVQDQLEVRLHLLLPLPQRHRRVDHRQHRAAALLAGADGHLAPVGQALVGAFILQAHFAALAHQGGDLRHAQLGGLLDGPVHALAPGQALAEVDPQRRLGQAGEGFAQFDADALLADLHQFADEFLARAVEQLDGITFGQAQHATDVVGLGFGQGVLPEGEGGVDEKAGKAHGFGGLKRESRKLTRFAARR